MNSFEAILTITDWQESNISDQLVGKTDGVAINRRLKTELMSKFSNNHTFNSLFLLNSINKLIFFGRGLKSGQWRLSHLHGFHKRLEH